MAVISRCRAAKYCAKLNPDAVTDTASTICGTARVRFWIAREFAMADVSKDQLAVIKIEGMHCHKCEKKIQTALGALPGVHEVEVDFASAQSSVLFDRTQVSVKHLMDTINEAGYHANGFTQNRADVPTV